MIITANKPAERFASFFSEAEPRLRHALVATYGPETGREAAADALEYGWANWERVEAMEFPTAYLYRVGRSAAKKYRRNGQIGEQRPIDGQPWVEPGLAPALKRLTERQRMAVVLRHGFGYSFLEIAEVMGVAVPTVQKHVDRGLEKLRRELRGGHDV